MSAERRYQIYVSGEIIRSLSLIAKHESNKPDNQGLCTTYGVEDMADRLLKGLFKEKYPQIFEHQKAVEQMEKKLLETL